MRVPPAETTIVIPETRPMSRPNATLHRRTLLAGALLLSVAALSSCGEPPNEERIEDLEEQIEELRDRIDALEERLR
jgi:hypothetical protein